MTIDEPSLEAFLCAKTEAQAEVDAAKAMEDAVAQKLLAGT